MKNRSNVALSLLQLWFAGLHAVHHWSMVRFDFVFLFHPSLIYLLLAVDSRHRRRTGQLVGLTRPFDPS